MFYNDSSETLPFDKLEIFHYFSLINVVFMTVSFRRVLKIYRSLDREQIQFVIDKKITGKYSVNDWLKRLHKIAVMDTIGDDSRKKSGNLAIIFGFLTVFTILLTISKPFMFFFPIGFFMLFLYFLVTFLTLSRIDIGNHMRLFIVPVLEKIEVENIVKSKVSLHMDFSNPATKENRTRSPEMEGNKKVYWHHWMNGEMTLTDNIEVKWNIKDLVKQRENSLQDRAANMDLTTNYEITHILHMEFLVPGDSFEAIDKNLSLTEGQDYYLIKIEREDTSASLEEGMKPETFLNSLKERYRQIRPRRKINI